jgi:cytochrome b subunit of formate dehydrogenase
MAVQTKQKTAVDARPRVYNRFSTLQRWQHVLLIISFTALAVSGLPQKFVGNPIAEMAIAVMGGIERTRVIHHFSAILLLVVSIAEFIQVGYKMFVERVRWTIFPQLQDVFDAVNQALHNLGMRKEAPKYDRYTFGEKFEYWALIWGTIIMAITGFMLWNPILTTRFLPGEWIPAAKAAHGGEAILAVLAILIWHFYNVHIRTFNRSIFTGKMSRHEMEEEHPLELERLEKQGEPTPVRAELISKRRRSFIPAAAILTAILLFGIYQFVTAESTAVDTVPTRPSEQVFVPRTRTPTATHVPTDVPATAVPPTATAGPPTATLEPGEPTFTPAPPTPTAAPVEASPTVIQVTGAEPLPPSHEGRAVCQVCHATGVGGAPVNPPDHEGRLDASCTDCHKPQ